MYTITLSDGVTTFNINDLEANGPGNLSTPRQILEVDLTGGAGVNFIKVANDLTTRFVPGQLLNILNSGGGLNDGVYTTVSSSFSIDRTTIVLVEALTSAGLPYGLMTYSIPIAEEETSLLLAGRGTLNYGEIGHNNLVHLLENFAALTPPPNPILGQQWYDITAQQVKFYDGVAFVSDVNIGSGTMSFIDPQHPTDPTNPTLDLTANDTDVGLSLTVTTDPASTDSIFRILSSGGSERLRVEHDGALTTTNILNIQGTGLSTFAGNIQIPNAGSISTLGGGFLSSNAAGESLIIQSGNAGQAPLFVKNSIGVDSFVVRGDDNVEVINNLITSNVTSTGTLELISTTGIVSIQGGAGVKSDVRFTDLDDSNYVSLQAPDVITTNRTWVLPVDDPTVVTGQFLTTDASGNLSFAIPAGGGGGGLNNVVEDLTPQLGGNLDVNGNLITSVSGGVITIITDTNGDLSLVSQGTGDVILQNLGAGEILGTSSTGVTFTTPNVLVTGGGTAGDLRIQTAGTFYISLTAPNAITANRTWVLPEDDPTVVAGQFLTTDASGVLSFAIPAGGGGGINNVVEDLTPQLGGNLDVNGFVLGGDVDGTGAVNTESSTIQLNDNNAGGLQGDIVIQGGRNEVAANGGDIFIKGGTNTLQGGAGAVGIEGGNVNGSLDSGTVQLISGTVLSGSGNSGNVTIHSGSNFGTGNVGSVFIGTGAISTLEVVPTGLMRILSTPNYENLVLSPNDIPNKQYVDDNTDTSKAKRFFFSNS